MSYELKFLPAARKEWDNLGATLREQFSKKLAERLNHPRVQRDALHGRADHYKIKLRQAGYRLVYRVDDGFLVVLVVAVGRRDGSEVYETAKRR